MLENEGDIPLAMERRCRRPTLGSTKVGRHWRSKLTHLRKVTHGACTRCTETFGNGATTGMTLMSRLVVSGAARSTTFLSTAVPRTATGTFRRSPSTSLVFVFRGPRAISELPSCPSSLCVSCDLPSAIYVAKRRRNFILEPCRGLS